MNSKRFNDIVEKRCETVKATLLQKDAEYGADGNRFHNFDVAARLDDETPEEALWGMYKKHLISVKDMVDNPAILTHKMIEDKITDSIAYHILLEGLFVRRMEKVQAKVFSSAREGDKGILDGKKSGVPVAEQINPVIGGNVRGTDQSA